MNIEVGQVLSLRMRFNNSGTISKGKHPYLVVGVDEDNKYVEIAQLDKLKGKEYKAASYANKVIYVDDPIETVIDQDSYIQNDNTMRLEYFEDLVLYRRQTDKLSKAKLDDVLKAYNNYHETHLIDEDKQVYITKAELLQLN